MKLYIAGGVYEHGRNCFYISRDNERNVMVDCGVKAGSTDYYPLLDEWQIKNTEYLFITHSHNDHCGALQWIIDRGFGGRIISTEETKSQIGIEYPHWTTFSFNEGSDRTTIDVDDISVISGMSGHCIGSVWYKMLVDGRQLLFTGDYCENTQSYKCSCLRDEFADMAVIDCAYGNSDRDMAKELSVLAQYTEKAESVPVILPVPVYGRGLEFISYICADKKQIPVYADDRLISQLQPVNSNWIKNNIKPVVSNVREWNNHAGLIMVSDAQLKNEFNRQIVRRALDNKGLVVFTGHVYPETYASYIMSEGEAYKISYPVHMNYEQVADMAEKNHFGLIVMNHSQGRIKDNLNLTAKINERVVYLK